MEGAWLAHGSEKSYGANAAKTYFDVRLSQLSSIIQLALHVLHMRECRIMKRGSASSVSSVAAAAVIAAALLALSAFGAAPNPQGQRFQLGCGEDWRRFLGLGLQLHRPGRGRDRGEQQEHAIQRAGNRKDR